MRPIAVILPLIIMGCTGCADRAATQAHDLYATTAGFVAEPYGCVTMRAPNAGSTVTFAPPNTVSVFGTMRADFHGTYRKHAEEQQADVTLTFDGELLTPGSGSSSRQAGVKLKELDPCNLIYVMYNINPFAGGDAGRDEISIKVKRNDGAHTSSDCGAAGYTTVKAIKVPASKSVGSDYQGRVRLKVVVKPPTPGGTYNLCLTVWGDSETGTMAKLLDAQCYNLNSIPKSRRPVWGGVIGMRTDNVAVSSEWAIPPKLSALIERDDADWGTHCAGLLGGGE
jgi:hypothetical protein